MKSQPNRDYVSNDVVMTPKSLCDLIVGWFNPSGSILEPCSGSGNFVEAFKKNPRLTRIDECEITRNLSFFDNNSHYDWIITNPPWSKINPFLYGSMRRADDVVFLMTVNHIMTKARLRDVNELGFHLASILLVPWPDDWPKSGFELGAVHLSKGKSSGSIKFADFNREHR